MPAYLRTMEQSIGARLSKRLDKKTGATARAILQGAAEAPVALPPHVPALNN